MGFLRSRSALAAGLGYLALTLAMTWPLALGLGRDIPGDMGDPVLNCWILGWDMSHMLRFLQGDLGAFRGFWNANIYYPQPLTLAYSEHLLPQALQALPLYALTGNLVLCHNVLFLSTFVLSGLGVFLLVRELTGSSAAAFVAGLVYAFAPYRTAQLNHVQVLSSQWMPFALWGLRRHFAARRLAPLWGGTLAFVLQGLSCGYFLLYFAPFVAAYALYEMVDRSLVSSARAWWPLLVAGLLTVAFLLPFLAPYQELRAAGGILRERWEVEQFSANVLSYVTASPSSRIWGDLLQVYPKPEGALFLSVVAVLLSIVGVASQARRAARPSHEKALLGGLLAARPRLGRALMAVVFAVLVFQALATVAIFAGAPIVVPGLRLRSPARALLGLVIASGALLVLSPRARAFVRGEKGSTLGFFLVAAIAAAVLSLGPTMMTGDSSLGAGPYDWLYAHVPGFDGLRVPARFAMIVMLFLSVLCGFGARFLEGLRRGRWVTVGVAALFLLEAAALPIQLNGTFKDPGYKRLPDHLLSAAETPPVYRAVAALSDDAVIVELPIGSGPWELRYMFYSTTHWRRLINGFSGGGPAAYTRIGEALYRPFGDPEPAWNALAGSGATHAVVHEWAWRHEKGSKVSEWLELHGARRMATEGGDVLFELPGR